MFSVLLLSLINPTCPTLCLTYIKHLGKSIYSQKNINLFVLYKNKNKNK